MSMSTMSLDYVFSLNGYYTDGFSNGTVINLPLGRRYLNRFGDINSRCSAPGMDCIPLEYSNIYINPGALGLSHNECENCTRVDMDITPQGRPSWISWFLHINH